MLSEAPPGEWNLSYWGKFITNFHVAYDHIKDSQTKFNVCEKMANLSRWSSNWLKLKKDFEYS